MEISYWEQVQTGSTNTTRDMFLDCIVLRKSITTLDHIKNILLIFKIKHLLV